MSLNEGRSINPTILSTLHRIANPITLAYRTQARVQGGGARGLPPPP